MERKKIFIDAPEPSDKLAARIMLCIEAHERRALRIKTAAFGAAFTGSFSLAVAGFVNFGAQVAHSGFLSFASLWLSDFSASVSNLPDLLSSMVESFPVLPAALVLGGAAFCVWSASVILSLQARNPFRKGFLA